MSPARTGTAPTDFDWAVRAEIYRAFATRGSAPALRELAATVRSTEDRVRLSFRNLFQAHEIATRERGDAVWMANPFSAVPTAYPVTTPRMSCWANCAWDALGVPAILGTDGWTKTTCAGSGEAIGFGVRGGRLEGDDVVVHLVTPLRNAWDDIGFT